MNSAEEVSSTNPRKTDRVPLKADNHLFGITLMFPEARDLSDTVDYYSSRVDPDDVEDVEAELAAADDFDEKHALQEEAAAK